MIRDTANDTRSHDSCQHEYSSHHEPIDLSVLTRLHEQLAPGTVAAVSVVGDTVVRLRMAAGYAAPKDFAKAISMSPTQLADVETGRYKIPNTRTLLKLATGLGVSVDVLLVGVDEAYDRTRSDAQVGPESSRKDDALLKVSSLQDNADQQRRGPRRAGAEGPSHGGDVQVPREPSAESSELPTLLSTLRAVVEDLRGGLADLRAVNDAVTDRVAAWATADAREQTTVARVVQPKKPRTAGRARRQNARKGTRR